MQGLPKDFRRKTGEKRTRRVRFSPVGGCGETVIVKCLNGGYVGEFFQRQLSTYDVDEVGGLDGPVSFEVGSEGQLGWARAGECVAEVAPAEGYS